MRDRAQRQTQLRERVSCQASFAAYNELFLRSEVMFLDTGLLMVRVHRLSHGTSVRDLDSCYKAQDP